MSMPFYVSPEQLIRDKADYARKGIARGRSVVVAEYAGGIAFVAENPSKALHKVSEIYDRIGFAAVGKYNEFENLRVAGVRYADLRGYSYDRADVTARGLANAYAQSLGAVFTSEPKPLEVEVVVAQVGPEVGTDQLYRLTYDGSVAEEHGVVIIGGQTESVVGPLREGWRADLDLPGVLALALRALSADPAGGPARTLTADQLEVAVLERARPRRTFRRLEGPLLQAVLDGKPVAGAPAAATVPPATGHSGLPSDTVDLPPAD
ncbi:proteasome alpha subunit [Quadrisphaera granulorum]|uniref:Proteasome subunit alpha n=1 Tax=Quadrisphaera granulorum TaxID=317664 RepID=A0A316A6S3_9ACTN|nr:proteasome subunit alpha [Quadrisphaera granulorum]PWJ53172.1 proteasome alpha subunit [Quadrisphaera granulorum]SZE97104.1 proteasome alpha subunit [Quadrisphaera granulorum]